MRRNLPNVIVALVIASSAAVLMQLAMAEDADDKTVTKAAVVKPSVYPSPAEPNYGPEKGSIRFIDTDPEETRTLATDPEYKELLKDFEAELRKICNPEAVDRKAKADQDALIEKFGGAEKAGSMGTPGATPVPGGTHE